MLKRISKALLSASLLFGITTLNASEQNSTKKEQSHQEIKEAKSANSQATKKEEHSTKEREKKKEPSKAKAETKGAKKTKESVKRKQESKKSKLKPLTPEKEKAAYRLFDALKMKDGIIDALIQSLDEHIARQPSMEPFRDIYVKFFKKYTKWDDMKKELAKIYAQAFSAEEMNKLADFYSSKLGAKSMVVLPRLAQLSMIVAQQRIAKHADELKDEVAKKAQELDSKDEEVDDTGDSEADNANMKEPEGE